MTSTSLSATQRSLLEQAITQHAGQLVCFPAHLKGGARKKVLDSLFDRALITPDGASWCVAAEGYDALGYPRPQPAASHPPIRSNPATDAMPSMAAKPGSKQQLLIDLLRQPTGATIDQMMQATHWQAHTIRGALAGTLRKKLQLAITSTKPTSGPRVYRITMPSENREE